MSNWDKQLEINFDLKQVLDSYEIKYVETSTHYILDQCPQCHGKRKFYVDKKEKFWVCFKCVKTNDFTVKDGRGNLQTFLKGVVGLTWQEVKKLLATGQVRHYTDEDMFPREIKQEEKQEVEEINLPSHFEPLLCTVEDIRIKKEAYKYLMDRHIASAEVIKQFGLLYSQPMKRVIFPIYETKTKLVGWQARDVTERWKNDHKKCNTHECESVNKWYFLGEEQAPDKCPSCKETLELNNYPKSRNSKNFPKTELFFNQQNVDWSQPISIVEGPFDCINTPNSMALLGKVLSKKQLNILLSKAKSVVIYLDGDQAGRFSTEQLIHSLSPFFDDLKVCPLEDGQDPGMFSRQTNQHRLSTLSVPASSWLADHV